MKGGAGLGFDAAISTEDDDGVGNDECAGRCDFQIGVYVVAVV